MPKSRFTTIVDTNTTVVTMIATRENAPLRKSSTMIKRKPTEKLIVIVTTKVSCLEKISLCLNGYLINKKRLTASAKVLIELQNEHTRKVPFSMIVRRLQ